jgi:hypothetical protein
MGHDTRHFYKWLDEIDELTKQNAKLLEALRGLFDIVSDSNGVAGYHLNGDIATWGEFDEVEFAEQAIAEAEGQS